MRGALNAVQENDNIASSNTFISDGSLLSGAIPESPRSSEPRKTIALATPTQHDRNIWKRRSNALKMRFILFADY